MTSISPRQSSVTVPEGTPVNLTILEFLSRRFPRISSEIWQKRILEGKVSRSDGTPAEAQSIVKPGMEFRYFREVVLEPGIAAEHQILYRDEHILAACKPHFLPVVPGGKFVNTSLLYRLMEETGLPELSPVHRIDRHTAGLVLFSVNEKERGAYQHLFKNREVEKEYLANVRWISEPPQGDCWDLEGRIEKRGPTLVRQLAPGAPNAFCRVRLLEQAGAFARLALFPLTGRRHQLRLQVGQIGAQILNDPYYPTLTPESPDDPGRPLQLISKHLRFRDPLTQVEHSFTSPRELLPLPLQQ